MITDAVISWFGQIVQFIYNLLPNPALFSGVDAAQWAINTFETIADGLIAGGLGALVNGPLTVIIDWTILAFGVGVLVTLMWIYIIAKLSIRVAEAIGKAA